MISAEDVGGDWSRLTSSFPDDPSQASSSFGYVANGHGGVMSSWVYVLTDLPEARSMVDVMIRENKVKYSSALAPKVCGREAGWQGKDGAGIPTREIDCLIDNSVVVVRLQGDPTWLSAQSAESLLFTMVDRLQYAPLPTSTPVA